MGIMEEKENKILYISQKYKHLQKQSQKLIEKVAILESENKEMKRKLEINKKHEELESVFSKLSSLMLANKIKDSQSLHYKEREMLNNLFGGEYWL